MILLPFVRFGSPPGGAASDGRVHPGCTAREGTA
jgi:hypothetical protein